MTRPFCSLALSAPPRTGSLASASLFCLGGRSFSIPFSMTSALCVGASACLAAAAPSTSKSVPCDAARCAGDMVSGIAAVGRPMLEVRFVFMVADDQMDAELLE